MYPDQDQTVEMGGVISSWKSASWSYVVLYVCIVSYRHYLYTPCIVFYMRTTLSSLFPSCMTLVIIYTIYISISRLRISYNKLLILTPPPSASSAPSR